MDFKKKVLELAEEVRSDLDMLNIPYDKNTPINISNTKLAWGDTRIVRSYTGRRCSIRIASKMQYATDKAIMNTIAHEYLHTTPRGDGHGYEWKKYANMVNMNYRGKYNIQRCNSESEYIPVENREKYNKATYKYMVKCGGCGYTEYFSKQGKIIQNLSRCHCRCGSHDLQLHTL